MAKLAGPPRRVSARGFQYAIGQYFRSDRGRNTYVVLDAEPIPIDRQRRGKHGTYTWRLTIAPIVSLPLGAVVTRWGWDRKR